MGIKLQSLRNFDAFPRAEDHLLQKTFSGAVVSIIGLSIMATLFVHELKYYLTTYTVHQMTVDLKRGETLPIHINMTFPSLPCEVLSVDAIDLSGKHEVDLDTNIWKLHVDSEGHILGTSEFLTDLVEKEHSTQEHDGDKDHHEDSSHKQHEHGDKDYHEDSSHKKHEHGVSFGSDAKKMIDIVKQAMEKGQGCRIFGVLDVQRVAGNFHISVHGLNMLVAQQIVPTEYRYLNKDVLPTNQFSVAEYFVPLKDAERSWPAVYFLYDLSPISVTIKEERRSFLHFITRLCAVLGGTFALTGMLDRWMYRLLESFTKTKTRSTVR